VELNIDEFFAKVEKKVASPSTKSDRSVAWRRMSETDYKASVALGFLGEMRDLCLQRDMPHPIECARAILLAPNRTTSSAFLSALLGIELPKDILAFLMNYDSTLGELMKSPENCYLGMLVSLFCE
jgi:hypothetical protein